jgi:hypothetical protein
MKFEIQTLVETRTVCSGGGHVNPSMSFPTWL